MYQKGEIVYVDSGVFTASPLRGEGSRLCEVLEDSRDNGQTYVSPLWPNSGSPMYVFTRDILRSEGK
jgi:hypothetical protein